MQGDGRALIGEILSVGLKKNPRQPSLWGSGGRFVGLLVCLAKTWQRFHVAVPEIFNGSLPSGRTLLPQPISGVGERRRRKLPDSGQKLREFRKEKRKMQFLSQGSRGNGRRRTRKSPGGVRVKRSLKGCDTRIEMHSFGSERISGSEFGSAVNAPVPLRADHCFERDLPLSASYHER